MGRTDDVLNVAGHRLSTGSIEAALAGHAAVAECAVIGVADELKGQVPRGLVVLKSGVDAADGERICAELVARVRSEVGAVAALRRVDIVTALPKTRSGKILRRTMREIADGTDAGDPPDDRGRLGASDPHASAPAAVACRFSGDTPDSASGRWHSGPAALTWGERSANRPTDRHRLTGSARARSAAGVRDDRGGRRPRVGSSRTMGVLGETGPAVPLPPGVLRRLAGAAAHVMSRTPIARSSRQPRASSAASVVVTGPSTSHRPVRWRTSLGEAVIGSLCSAYVNAGNLGIPIALYVLGDISLMAPTLLLQLLVITPVSFALLDSDRRGHRPSLQAGLRSVVRNPITVAALAGVACRSSRTICRARRSTPSWPRSRWWATWRCRPC